MAAAPDMTPPAGAYGFLARYGWGGAKVVPLAGDASFRRYFRVFLGGASAVLMDAPPPHEDARSFLRLSEHLCGIGLSAPRGLAAEPEAGLVLLEDFGDLRLGPLLKAEPGREAEMYRVAVDILVHLHGHAPAEGLRPYSASELEREVLLFSQWYLPALGRGGDEAAYLAAWREAWSLLEGLPHSVTVLRDYHADNLMWLPEREGVRRLGLLDFQDALAGHPAYDLVSLLQDARRDVSEATEVAMLAHYAAGAGPVDRAVYELLGAQRNTKILGIFTRLWKRDGKPAYLALQPRVWGYLERNLMHPALAPVRAWFDANVPPALRAPAWDRAA